MPPWRTTDVVLSDDELREQGAPSAVMCNVRRGHLLQRLRGGGLEALAADRGLWRELLLHPDERIVRTSLRQLSGWRFGAPHPLGVEGRRQSAAAAALWDETVREIAARLRDEGCWYAPLLQDLGELAGGREGDDHPALAERREAAGRWLGAVGDPDEVRRLLGCGVQDLVERAIEHLPFRLLRGTELWDDVVEIARERGMAAALLRRVAADPELTARDAEDVRMLLAVVGDVGRDERAWVAVWRTLEARGHGISPFEMRQLRMAAALGDAAVRRRIPLIPAAVADDRIRQLLVAGGSPERMLPAAAGSAWVDLVRRLLPAQRVAAIERADEGNLAGVTPAMLAPLLGDGSREVRLAAGRLLARIPPATATAPGPVRR